MQDSPLLDRVTVVTILNWISGMLGLFIKDDITDVITTIDDKMVPL